MENRKKLKKELMKKKIGELRKMAGRYSIEIKPNWTRDKIANLIIERRIVPVAQQIKDNAQARKDQQPAGQQPAGQAAVNPAFEQAAQVVEPPAGKQEKRGGVREGAGRQLGLTDEKAKVKNLPQYPSNPIKQGSQALFDLWASAAKIEELALSEDEADLWSLPITQLAEYYFPGMIPEIAGTWVMMIFAVTRIMKPRIKLIEEVRKQRRSAQPAGPEKAEPAKETRLLHYKAKDGTPLHALEPGVEVLFTENPLKLTCQVCKNIIKNLSMN